MKEPNETIKFKSRADISKWTEDKSRDILIVFAARAALRTVPFFASIIHNKNTPQTMASAIILPSLWAAGSVLSAGTWPDRAEHTAIAAATSNATTAAAAIADTDATTAARTIAYAAATTTATTIAAIATTAAITATNAAATATTTAAATATTTVNAYAAYAAYSNDANAIANGLDAKGLAFAPLWPDRKTPTRVRERWENLKTFLLDLNEDWDVWTGWYESILRGGPRNPDLEIARISFPHEDYTNAKVLNPKIKALYLPPESNLKQLPGAFKFSQKNGKLEAEEVYYPPSNSTTAEEALQGLYELAKQCLSTLQNNDADDGLAGVVQRFSDLLNVDIKHLKAGLLLMQISSLEGFAEAFSHPDNQREKNVLGALRALTNGAEKFQGFFPDLLDVQANSLSLSLQGENATAVNENLDQICILAQQSDVVGLTAVKALSYGKLELSEISNKINFTYNHEQKSALIKARGKVTAQRVLNTRNFTSKALDEIKDIPIQALKGVSHGVYEGTKETTKALVKIGIAVLIAKMAGPMAGTAVYVTSLSWFSKKSADIKEITESSDTIE